MVAMIASAKIVRTIDIVWKMVGPPGRRPALKSIIASGAAVVWILRPVERRASMTREAQNLFNDFINQQQLCRTAANWPAVPPPTGVIRVRTGRSPIRIWVCLSRRVIWDQEMLVSM